MCAATINWGKAEHDCRSWCTNGGECTVTS